MTITLFNNASDPNVVNKDLTQVASLSVDLKDNCSILNPELFVRGQIPTGFNYFYIPEFQRYYYVTDQITDKNGMVHIFGHVDVLYTYRTKIYAMQGVAERSESIYNKYLEDNLINTLCYNRFQIKKFGLPVGGDSTGRFYLTVSGK